MQKLSELFGKICSASERGKKGVLVDLQTISEIRDEFWALEQRASNLNDGWLNAIAERDEARAKLAELEKQEESRWNTHDGIARPIGVDKDDLVYLRMKRQEIKLPYPAGMVNWKHDGGEFDVIAWASVYSSPRAAPAADRVPEGWKLVPVEPTEEMIAAGDQFMDGLSRLGDAYDAMLAAAPEVE
ncbi:hypothetical protein WKG93_08795 [Pantoea agglomerans]|uniref:hypothetical protein n=1 Tax=Enterobacter agglomerans TaxID=549 RepID=UPI0023AE6DB2|nr:hypothetical protein [Pantoea agglomerans]WEC73594.1 hypothetical protein LDO72_05870 [Pantoea agglomerans]